MTPNEKKELTKAAVASVIELIDQADRDGVSSPCPDVIIRFSYNNVNVDEPQCKEYLQELVEDDHGKFQPQPSLLR